MKIILARDALAVLYNATHAESRTSQAFNTQRSKKDKSHGLLFILSNNVRDQLSKKIAD